MAGDCCVVDDGASAAVADADRAMCWARTISRMSGTSHIKGQMSAACLYCHVPHSGNGKRRAVGADVSHRRFTRPTSATRHRTRRCSRRWAQASSLCLSCHDGTVAVGQVTPYGPYHHDGDNASAMGSQLQGSHPFSLQAADEGCGRTWWPVWRRTGRRRIRRSAVNLIQGQCGVHELPQSAHSERRQAVTEFPGAGQLKGAICLACHETNPRTVNRQDNPLATWSTSVHANAGEHGQSERGPGWILDGGRFCLRSCHT